MSSIEERLHRDITALMEGVVVTESDLRDARNAVDERIVLDRRRGRRRTAVLAAAAALVVGAVGVAAYQSFGDDAKTAPPAGKPRAVTDFDAAFLVGTPPTAALVAGVWRVDNGSTAIQFGENGTVRFDELGVLVSDPAVTGTYTIDGDLITVTLEDGPAECTGTEFAMRAALQESGNMRFVLGEAPTEACLPLPVGQQTLEHVLPTSPGMAGLVLSTESGWMPLSEEAKLYGDWQAEGGGYVLEIAPGGGYFVLDESTDVVDRGRWSLRGADLTLTSSARSTECTDGDQLVLGGMEYVDPGTTVLRATVEQNTCGAPWTPVAWILLPHIGTM
jgi:hypothetical protein